MNFKRKGIPEIDELVLCTVKRLTPHGAFVDIDEYDNVEGMLHVNEVALRGVKDIRDYLSVGKKLVCKVLSSTSGQIDVSLKRVNSGARKQKLNESRVENRFYHLIEHACVEAKKPDYTQVIVDAFVNKFGSLYNSFEALKNKGLGFLDGISLPDGVQEVIHSNFESLLKQLSVSIRRTITMSSFEGDGVNKIKSLLSDFKLPNNVTVSFSYLGSGKFLMNIEAVSYKAAEEFFDEFSKSMLKSASSLKVKVAFSE